MTSDVGGIPLPESLSGPCRRLRYHETNNSKVQNPKAPQLHKASLWRLDVDWSNGCRTRVECWAMAVCVDRTDRMQLQRPPSVCMLMYVREQTKTRGNPDRDTRVPATKSVGLPRCQCVCNAVAQPPKSECVRHLIANIRSRLTRLTIVLASSSNMTRARSAAVSLGPGSRPSVGLKTACLGLDCHEFSSTPSHA
jgi:hypothetical protein